MIVNSIPATAKLTMKNKEGKRMTGVNKQESSSSDEDDNYDLSYLQESIFIANPKSSSSSEKRFLAFNNDKSKKSHKKSFFMSP